MRGIIYPKKEKEEVKRAILSGKSYSEIEKLFGVPKSTTSTWFGKTLKKPANRETMLNHLKRIRKFAAIKIRKKWKEIRREEDRAISDKVKSELSTYPLNNIGFYKSMLSMLYWAEGSKYEGVCGLQFVNTDPELIKFFIGLLRKCYNINERKFHIRIHIHYYHSINTVKKFWSNLLNVPLYQFGKIYIKKRSKTKRFRKNFMGICFIRYGDSKIRKEILGINKALQNKIQ